LFAHAPSSPEVDLQAAVFDNASRDGSADMVGKEFPKVRLIQSPTNVGFARANNLLAESSTADYLMLLNSDVAFTMDVVSPLLTVLDSDPKVAIVGPMLMSDDRSVQPSSQRFPTLRFELATLFGHGARRLFPNERVRRALDDAVDSIAQQAVVERRIHDTEHLWATCWLLRRSDIREDGLFDDEFFVTYDEDLDYCRRVRGSGRRIVWVPQAQLVHFGGKSSDKLTKQTLQGYGRRTYYARYHGTVSGVAYRIMSSAAMVSRGIYAQLSALKKSITPTT
jgi:hypothetical protein